MQVITIGHDDMPELKASQLIHASYCELSIVPGVTMLLWNVRDVERLRRACVAFNSAWLVEPDTLIVNVPDKDWAAFCEASGDPAGYVRHAEGVDHHPV